MKKTTIATLIAALFAFTIGLSVGILAAPKEKPEPVDEKEYTIQLIIDTPKEEM